VAAFPEPLAALIAELGKLPGIGPRSAERLGLYLVQSDKNAVEQLSRALLDARERIHDCDQCGALTENSPCAICGDPRRDPAVLCLVERPVDIFSIEKAAAFRGLYHVLGGRLSPVNGIGPEDLRIAALERRLDAGGVTEIIIALGSDVEGDATSFYLAKRLAPRGLKLTRLAHGLPVGSSLEFADELTLNRAIEGRQTMI
jgi:recombination protein RecR